MKKKYLILTVCSIIAMPAAVAWADDAAGRSAMLEEVVVTAGRVAEEKKTISANITVVDREELAQAVSVNVGDLLAEKGIGHVQKYPGALTSVGIRGFRTDTLGNDLQGHVLILLDGRRAGTGNAAKLLTKNVERIEVIRGPGAVQYGSAGIGGVVNVITRKGESNAAFVEGGGGAFDRAEGSIGGEAKEGAFDFAGSITSQTAGDYDTGGGETFHNTGIESQWGISLNGGYTLADKHRLGLIFTGFEVSEAGSPGYLSQNDLDDYTDKKNYSLDLQYTGSDSGSRYQWMARYFFGRDENVWVDPTDSNPNGWDNAIDSSNTTDQQGAQAQVRALYDNASVTLGFDWLDYEVENTWTPEQTTYNNPAVFLLAKTELLNDTLIANGGLRYDWFSVEVSEPAGRDEEQSRLTPQIGLAWLANENLKWRLNYGQGFMMPSADQLAADYSAWGRRTVGNPDLDPEKSSTYEGGVDVTRGSLAASLTYFYTDFQDKIVSTSLADGTRSWTNLGDATLSGFEAELAYDLGEPLGLNWEVRPYLNLTYLTEFEDEATGEDLLYVSSINGSAGLVINNGEGLFCRLNVAYAGHQDVQDWKSGIYPTPVVEFASSTVADLTASWEFWQDENFGALTLRGEIRNLMDEEYAYVKGYPMPGRSVYLGLRWDY